MKRLTLYIRDLKEQPSFVVSDGEAERVHQARAAGPKAGTAWAVKIEDLEGGTTTIGLDGVLWVTDETVNE